MPPTFRGTGAEIVVQALAKSGVAVVFGVPGDTGVALYDALARQSAVRHVLANDERGAAFMADVYARRTNGLGVLEVSSGGGVTFAVGGLGEAFAASVPILVITSDISRRSRNTGALTEIDQTALFSGVTKWRATAESAEDLPRLLSTAIETALTGRPAPVVVIIPEDVLDEVADVRINLLRILLPWARPNAAAEQVEILAERFRTATRPVMVCGGGVHLSRAYEQVAHLAQLAGVPIATTLHGKGAIAESSEWSLGVVGANGGGDAANRYVASIDWALLVGSRSNATDTSNFTAPPRTAPTIAQIDIEPTRAGRNYPGAISLVGDAAVCLDHLLKLLPRAADTVREQRLREVRIVRELDEYKDHGQPGRGVDPGRLFASLSSALPSDVPIVSDCGTPTPYLGAAWRLREAGRWLVLARGHGPMGYALPGAVGAALADQDRRVLAIITDGSLLMAAGALETAARLCLPITYIHLNNASLGWMKALQHLYYGRRYFETDLTNFDAVGVARGFGLNARRARDVADVIGEVQQAMSVPGPTFIDVEIPDESEFIPPVASWKLAAKGEEIARPTY